MPGCGSGGSQLGCCPVHSHDEQKFQDKHLNLIVVEVTHTLGSGPLRGTCTLLVPPPTATPNNRDKLSVSIELLQLVFAGHKKRYRSCHNGNVMWAVKLPWSISPGPNGTTPLATACNLCYIHLTTPHMDPGPLQSPSLAGAAESGQGTRPP